MDISKGRRHLDIRIQGKFINDIQNDKQNDKDIDKDKMITIYGSNNNTILSIVKKNGGLKLSQILTQLGWGKYFSKEIEDFYLELLSHKLGLRLDQIIDEYNYQSDYHYYKNLFRI